jgi:hypothetical protein
MFHAIQKLYEEDPNSASDINFQQLFHSKIFPVSRNWNLEKDTVTALESADEQDAWFIADTAPLRTVFAGVVPLLDVRLEDLAAMETLLTRIGLRTRFLSRLVESVPKIEGEVVEDEELTELFRGKVEFIIRYIGPSSQFPHVCRI